MLVGLTGASAFAAFVLVLANLDPFILLPTVFGGEMAKGFAYKIIRFVVYIYAVEAGLTSFRGLYMTALVLAMFRMQVLKLLCERLPIRQHVRLYKENRVVERLMYDNEFKIARYALVSVYFGVVLSVNVIIIAVNREQPMLTTMAVIITVAFLSVLHMVVVFGCIFLNLSETMLGEWGIKINGTHNSFDRKELKRVLASFRPISLPAGGMGVINKDMKVSYLEHMLGTLVDTLML